MVNLLFAKWVPINPEFEYLQQAQRRLGVSHWGIGVFQPIYLGPRGWRGETFILTVYRDVKNRVKFLKVLVNGEIMGEKLEPVPVFDNTGLKTQIKSNEDLNSLIKRGDRIGLIYVSNTRKTADQPDVEEPVGKLPEEVCSIQPKMCQVVKYVYSVGDDRFLKFEKTGKWALWNKFPIISVDMKFI